MSLNRRALVSVLAVLIAACGGDDVVEIVIPTVPATATSTAAPPTSTRTAVPTGTATLAPSSTAVPTSTPTLVPTAVPTSTETPTPTATAEDTATATATQTAAAVGAMALFHADGLDPANPFPSDRLRDETGHVHVTGTVIGADLPADPKYDMARVLADTVAVQLTQLEGFSTFAPVRVKFDAPVAAPPPGGVSLIDCEAGDIPIHVEATTLATSGDNALEIYPVRPLRPKTTYVYVVTKAVLDANGDPVSPSPELTQLLDGEVPPALAPWAAELACALDLLDLRGVARDDIALIDVFTTQPTTDGLLAVKDLFATGTLQPATPQLESSPIGDLPVGVHLEGTTEFTTLVGSPTSDTIAAVAVGSFASYDFRKNGSAFDPELLGGGTVPPVNNLDFYMTIPKAPAPEGGYPIVIFGHGLGGSSKDAIDAAKLLGDVPLMVIGISAVSHGRRGEVLQFFNLTDGFATRENFRQTVADTIQLEQMIHNTVVPPFDRVNRDRIEYFGISLGGIMGTIFMGHDPNVRVGMLSVPGGGLPNIIQSNLIGALLKPLISATYGISLSDPMFPAFFHRFSQLSQWVIDAGDPINVAPVILDATRSLPGVPVKRILMHEGIIDDVVPNQTTDELAIAMGLPDVAATLGCSAPTGCSGIWRFDMAQYGFGTRTGHGVTEMIPQAAAQAAEFLLSEGTVITDASPD